MIPTINSNQLTIKYKEPTDGTEGVEGTRVDRQTFLGKKYLDE